MISRVLTYLKYRVYDEHCYASEDNSRTASSSPAHFASESGAQA
jgi:hypothetical protein